MMMIIIIIIIIEIMIIEIIFFFVLQRNENTKLSNVHQKAFIYMYNFLNKILHTIYRCALNT